MKIMCRIISLFIILMFSVFCICGCSGESLVGTDIYTMSTVVTVSIPKNTENKEELLSKAKSLIYGIENEMSVNIKASDIAKFNQSEAGISDIGEDTAKIMKIALDVADKTDGAFNPCMGALTSLWDITGKAPRVPDAVDIEAALTHTDYKDLKIEENELKKSDSELKIDSGGITKGYALQRAVELLSENARYGTVSFGGNVGVFGKKPDSSPWKVGIKNPFDTGKEVGYIQIDGGYIAVSGDYERYFEENGKRYHHILNPKTGYPTDNRVHSVAVYCKDATLGDALSTALFVMGYEKGMELYHSGKYDYEALFITDDGIFKTDNLDFHGETN